MELDECISKGFIRRTNIDHPLIKSLIEMSNSKESFVNSGALNQENISIYVSLAYDSLREILEAICILQGYKVISHDCMGQFLKERVKSFKFEEFDRFRWTRNKINYYGKKVDLNQGKHMIRKMLAMKKSLFLEGLKQNS